MAKISKKYLVIFILAILVLSYFTYSNYEKWFSWKQNSSEDVIFDTLETFVEKKSFDDEIELNWDTKIKNEQKIKFNTSGKITEVRYQIWDSVKKWETLVAIESTSAQADINKASIALDKARRDFEKVISELKDSKLKLASWELETSKMNLDQKEKDLLYLKDRIAQDLKLKQNALQIEKNSYIIQEAEIKKNLAISRFDKVNQTNATTEKNLSYEKLKRDYNEAVKNFDSKLATKINDYKIKLENTYYDLEKDMRDFQTALDDMWVVLWIKWNFEYSVYFSAKNTMNVSKMREYYYKADQDFIKLKEAFKKVDWKSDAKNIIATLEVGKNFYENAYLAFTYLNQGFEDSVDFKWSVSEFNPSSYASKFSWALSRSTSMRTSITTLIDELKNYDSEEKIKKDLQDELDRLKLSLENAEIDIQKYSDETNYSTNTFDANQQNMIISIENLKISLERKILDHEKEVKTLNDEYRQAEISFEKDKISYKKQEEEFEKIKNLSKNDEFLSAEESVKQAELNLEDARKKLENYIIQAPFDWVITKMDYKVWDRITENSDSYVFITDPNIIEINVFINQTDVVRVKKDMKANIVLESYPDQSLEWTLTEIDTTPTTDQNTWLSKFSAKVLIWDYGDLKLYTGMRATVKLKLSSIPESLVVPFTAVNSEEDWRKFVTAVDEKWNKTKKYIEVWEVIWNYYQVLSWVEEWEKILEIDYDATKIKEEEQNFWGWYYWI